VTDRQTDRRTDTLRSL